MSNPKNYDLRSLVRPNVLKIKPYVPGKPMAEVERELGLTDLAQLSVNENFRAVNQDVLEKVAARLGALNRYPDGGCYYLKKKLAESLGLTPEHLVFGNGGDEVIAMLCETFIRPGQEMLTGDPTFVAYSISAQIADATIVKVPLRDFHFDLKAMAAAVTEKTRLVIVCNPNNPTGTIVGHDEMADFLESLPPTVVVLFDEAYCEFVESPDFPRGIELLSRFPNLILLRTFSKIFSLAGVRIGYGIANPELISYLNLVRKPYNVNSVAQFLAEESLDHPELVETAKSENLIEKEFLYNSFKERGLSFVPSEANYIFVDIQKPSETAVPAMIKKGVIVRAGHVFGFPTYVRATIGSRAQNERFLAVLREI